jgi:hypothetical protein
MRKAIIELRFYPNKIKCCVLKRKIISHFSKTIRKSRPLFSIGSLFLLDDIFRRTLIRSKSENKNNVPGSCV